MLFDTRGLTVREELDKALLTDDGSFVDSFGTEVATLRTGYDDLFGSYQLALSSMVKLLMIDDEARKEYDVDCYWVLVIHAPQDHYKFIGYSWDEYETAFDDALSVVERIRVSLMEKLDKYCGFTDSYVRARRRTSGVFEAFVIKVSTARVAAWKAEADLSATSVEE